MTKRTSLRWLALLAVFVLLVAACGDDDDAATPTTGAPTTAAPATTAAPTTEAPKAAVRVPAINQQDGVFSFPEVTTAVEAIFGWYNANGGLDGHPLELDLCTSGDDPESTQRCAQAFANDDDVEYVFPMATPNSAVMYEVLGTAGIPLIGGLEWDIPDALPEGFYSADPGLLAMADVLVNYMVDDLAMTNVAVVTQDSDLGQGTVDFIGFLLESAGAAVQPIFYDIGSADYLPAFAAVDLDAIDGLLFLAQDPSECGPGAQALDQLGFDKPVTGGDQCAQPAFVETGLMENWYFVVTMSGLIEGDPGRELILGIFEQHDGPDITGFVGAVSLQTFWLIEVLEAAYEAGGIDGLTSDGILAAAEGWSGSLTLGPETLDCPGTPPFLSVCNPAARMTKLVGGKFESASDWRLVDLEPYAALLEG